MVLAHPDMLCVEGKTGRAVVAVDGPRPGKVGIVIGGGSGHEPAFALYVGNGLADAAAVGNVFASPSPEQIIEAAIAADGGEGILFLYGNYTGDVLNFALAAEQLTEKGLSISQVQVTDDAASAAVGREHERRGIAGDFFVFKIAGAAAHLGEPLVRVEALARHANNCTRSIGVALEPCSLPQIGKANFDIAPGVMEIGMGLHGEPGIRTEPLASADTIVDSLMEILVNELRLSSGDRVAVLINGLGATSLLELYILNRRVAQVLEKTGVTVHYCWVGEYATSLEMAGASITLLKLDSELQKLLDHPCRTPVLTVGTPNTPVQNRPRHRSTALDRETTAEASIDSSLLITEGDVTPAIFRSMLRRISADIANDRDWLSELDGAIGDGDHGVTMETGWTAVIRELETAPSNDTIEALCKRAAKAFLDAVGATSGPLYATAFLRAGAAVSDRCNLDSHALVKWLEAATQGIRERGRAEPGDKTMVDAWAPASISALAAANRGSTSLDTLRAARDGAEAGMRETAELESKRGRAAKLGARSCGHIDPGAASTWITLRAMTAALEEALA